MEQEQMEYDVIIVGAGPAGLSAAIRIKQLSPTCRVCILEKGAQVGAHILSGAVLDPCSLQTLLPDTWSKAPFYTPVTEDKFYYFSSRRAFALPLPALLKNKGNYLISLGELCRFLAKEAEEVGCEIYPGFAASKLLFDAENRLVGVATGEVGIDRSFHKTNHYQPGMQLIAKQTLFAEGCRGELSQELMRHYDLRNKACPQTYALGIKEIWSIPAEKHEIGKVIHTVGWPLDRKTYGGSFLYHIKKNQVALGLVLGLDYQNPWLNPFEEMQKWKTHPIIHTLLKDGERIAYGARALNEGGFQSLPTLAFPGGALLGDAAGFLHVAKIKGIHMAIQSGILAAESCVQSIDKGSIHMEDLDAKVRNSWLGEDLYKVRNVRPGFRYGLWAGLLNAFVECSLTKGKSFWTLKNHHDYTSLLPAEKCKKIVYAKPDNILTFDKLSSVYLANTYHEENQPCHLQLKKEEVAIVINDRKYASPESRYCPAQVYEMVEEDNKRRLQINFQNCIHCKACDIKDPTQNIHWSAPEGGGGPNYEAM